MGISATHKWTCYLTNRAVHAAGCGHWHRFNIVNIMHIAFMKFKKRIYEFSNFSLFKHDPVSFRCLWVVSMGRILFSLIRHFNNFFLYYPLNYIENIKLVRMEMILMQQCHPKRWNTYFQKPKFSFINRNMI